MRKVYVVTEASYHSAWVDDYPSLEEDKKIIGVFSSQLGAKSLILEKLLEAEANMKTRSGKIRRVTIEEGEEVLTSESDENSGVGYTYRAFVLNEEVKA